METLPPKYKRPQLKELAEEDPAVIYIYADNATILRVCSFNGSKVNAFDAQGANLPTADVAKAFKLWMNQLCGVGQTSELAMINVNGETYQEMYQCLSNGNLTRVIGTLTRLQEWAEQCAQNGVFAGTLISVSGSQAATIISSHTVGPFTGVPPNSGL